MKTNPIRIVIAAGVVLGASLFPATSAAQPSISNLYDALSRSDTRYSEFTYDPADAVIQDTDTEHHIQGIAYANRYYYVAQSRPDTANTEKLLVISEDTQTVVNKLDLDPDSIHPGGFQAHNGYLVIPFEVSGGNAKLNFYSLSTPTNPVLVASYPTALGNGYCAGMTDYGDKYLVAQYYSRTGSIRFYHFDASFNKVAEKTWRAPSQTDKSGWYPYTDWRTGDFNYEAMNLIKVLPPGSSTPSYFMIMYHNSDSADVFALSDPNLTDALQVTMVYSLKFTPYGPGFRYGAGVSITDQNNLFFFSSLKHLHASKSANVISDFESRPAWPWRLTYNYATGGDADVAINDSGVCVELGRGAPGTADESKIFSQVGVTMPATRTVAWGSSVDTGQTGEAVSVALNSSGYCVALSRGTGSNSNQHTYRVGQVDVATKTITWGTAVNHQTGGNLSVALDDSNHVVEVHRGSIGGASENKHYYRVGTLDPSTKTITWLSGGTNYGTGGDLSLAIDDSGHAIEVHRGTPGTSSANSHYCRTASIDYSTGVITWGTVVSYDSGGDVDIDLDNSGRCLEVHRGTPGGSNEANHYYKIGAADFSTGTVTWSSGGLFDTGGSVAVAIDNLGNGIDVHRGRGSSTQRYYRLFVPVPATSGAATPPAKPLRATITLSGLTPTYDGTAKAPVAVTTPANLAVALTYAGGVTAPTNAGRYPVVAATADPNYIGSATGVLVIQPAAATVTLSDLSHTYDGSSKSALATTSPVGLPVSLTYDGEATAPTNAGSYSVGASVTDPNYAGSGSGTLSIAKAAPVLTWNAPAAITYGTALGAAQLNATASVPGTFAYTPTAGTVLNAGPGQPLATVFTPDDVANYEAGSAQTTLTVDRAIATLSLGSLAQRYDGTPKPVTVTTTPSGLTVSLTYDGATAEPIDPGVHTVVAAVDDANYSGTITETLKISVTALVRHAPTLGGMVDGSMQMLSAEDVTLNGNATLAGDLLVPGSPALRLNGKPMLAGEELGEGSAAPANYTVTLNSGVVIRYLVRQVDPIGLPVVAAPAAPTGTRSVTLNKATDSAGDFGTLRNLTINGGAGAVTVPPGAYGQLTANGGSSFVFGVAGATTPAVYDLQNLTLNGTAVLRLVGPVTLTLANGVTFNGTVGDPAHPEWLTLNVAAGGVTLNGSATLSGGVVAPGGMVMLNGDAMLHGTVVADRLVLNGNSLINDLTQ